MDQLVTQGAQAVAHLPQHAVGIAITKGTGGAAFAAGKTCLPFFFTYLAALAVPEAFESKGVVQQVTDGAGIFLPDGIFNTFGLI